MGPWWGRTQLRDRPIPSWIYTITINHIHWIYCAIWCTPAVLTWKLKMVHHHSPSTKSSRYTRQIRCQQSCLWCWWLASVAPLEPAAKSALGQLSGNGHKKEVEYSKAGDFLGSPSLSTSGLQDVFSWCIICVSGSTFGLRQFEETVEDAKKQTDFPEVNVKVWE